MLPPPVQLIALRKVHTIFLYVELLNINASVSAIMLSLRTANWRPETGTKLVNLRALLHILVILAKLID